MGNIGLLATFGLTAGTVWLVLMRFRIRPDNSWPLLYYFCAVVYLNSFDLVLNPYVVYVAVICALLLRFEFMNERLVFLVRLIEVASLAHMGWRLFGALLKELR